MTQTPDFIAVEIAKSESERCRVTLGARHLIALKRGIDAACEEARRRGVLDSDPAGCAQ